MTAVNKIDSNATGLRYQEETSFKVANTANDWIPLEPNEYNDFGGELTLLARNPINDSRQRKKGVITDLDATGGFVSDFTQTNMQDILQGFMYAALRPKGEEIVTAVDLDTTNDDEYEVAATAGFLVGSLILGSNFTNAGNNTMNVVTAITTDASVEVADATLTVEASPPADAQITVVGHEATADDLDVDVTLTFPALTSTILDFTTLGLIPGEFVFVGGDATINKFSAAANNGIKRIRSITATRLEFDKSDVAMSNETSSGSLLIRLFFGRVLKNEQSTLIARRTYQLERTLGAPDDASPAQIQAEYLEGAVPSEFVINIPTADKLTAGLSFIAGDHTTIDGPTALKTGAARPAIDEADAFNTSSDISRFKLAVHVDGTEAPSALFAFVTDLTLTINNNLSPNKAIATLGAFDVSAGTFQVSAALTAYFADVAAVAAVRNNSNVTLDFFIVKNNAGMVVDLPLVALGDGRLNVEQDQPVTLPISMDAATASAIDSDLDHTLMWTFFDYLPSAADV